LIRLQRAASVLSMLARAFQRTEARRHGSAFRLERLVAVFANARRPQHSGSVTGARAVFRREFFGRVALTMRVFAAALSAYFWRISSRCGATDSGLSHQLTSESRFFWSAAREGWGAICALLKRCRPAHVTWFIVAVVVDSVDRVLRTWTRPHVVKECLKRYSPTVAHCNASAAVEAIRLVRCLETTTLHAVPDRIQLMSRIVSPCMTVRGISVNSAHFHYGN